MLHRIVFVALIILYHLPVCQAQDKGWTPELKAMHANARASMARGNYKEAITTYKQLQALRTDDANILAELSQAYAKNGDIDQATVPLEKVGISNNLTDTGYVIVSQVFLAAKGQLRNANKFANWGLKKYPNSGILYEQQGNVYNSCGNTDAIAEWQTGMTKAPLYPGNYKQAAIFAANNGNIWPVIWGETYLAMAHDTTGDASFKELLYQCWKNYFEQLPNKQQTGTAFDQYLANTLLQLTPVISDGISTETLTMIKVRFMLQWQKQQQYKVPLFDWYDTLLKNGWFDIYNEWLYGGAENAAQYAAWTTFHKGDIERFAEWKEQHQLQPHPADSYYKYVNIDEARNWTKKKKR